MDARWRTRLLLCSPPFVVLSTHFVQRYALVIQFYFPHVYDNLIWGAFWLFISGLLGQICWAIWFCTRCPGQSELDRLRETTICVVLFVVSWVAFFVWQPFYIVRF